MVHSQPLDSSCSKSLSQPHGLATTRSRFADKVIVLLSESSLLLPPSSNRHLFPHLKKKKYQSATRQRYSWFLGGCGGQSSLFLRRVFSSKISVPTPSAPVVVSILHSLPAAERSQFSRSVPRFTKDHKLRLPRGTAAARLSKS